MYSNAGYIFSQAAGLKGLVNYGSTCYINAVLQCLMGSEELILLIERSKRGPVSCALSKVLLSLKLKCVGEAEDISNFLYVIAQHWDTYRPSMQMDVEEFLTFLLDTLHEEMRTETVTSNEIVEDMIQNCVNIWTSHNVSIISSLFHVQIVTLIMCTKCHYSCAQYGDINSHLSVGLPFGNDSLKSQNHNPIRLEDCLLSFTKEEVQTDAKCSSCNAGGLKHRLILGRLPRILVIHLKRFRRHYDGSLRKISKDIVIPECLDVAPCTVELLQSSTSYSLFAMTNHHGTSIHNGHYTAVCRREDRWHNFDDTKVSSTTSRKLASASNTAYLVWYRLNKVDNDLPLDQNPKSNTDLTAAPIIPTPEQNNSASPNLVDQPFVDSDGDNDMDLFTMTDEEDSGSDEGDRIFSLRRSQKNIDYNPVQAEVDFSNLTIQDTTQPSHHSQEGVSQVTSQQLCDHPLYDLDIMDPQLNEDDIPGAKINLDEIDTCKKASLIKWLQCRRLSPTGNIPELRARIIFHAKNHKENKINKGFEGGKWYEEKRKRLMAEANQANQKRFPMMPFGPGNKIFQPFPSVHIPNKYSSSKARDYLDLIPDVRFSYVGGVESGNGDEAEGELGDFSQSPQHERRNIFVDGTLKRANNFIDSGRVLGINDCIRNDHYFVKADVRASYMDVIYKVSVMISKTSGDVCFAECTCKARALGRCCHIFAVLLLIGRHVESNRHEAVTCTGRLCYWLAPGSEKRRQPCVVHEKNEYYKNSATFKRRAFFDPRPTAQQLVSDSERLEELCAALTGMPNKILWY